MQTNQPRRLDKKLDLLFVVDNSRLDGPGAGLAGPQLPAVHARAGGAGAARPAPRRRLLRLRRRRACSNDNCRGLGTRVASASGRGCGLARGRPLPGGRQPDGSKNFTGELVDVFGCLATLGTEGCGYEHQLQSMRVALSYLQPGAGDFLRPDAQLAIVMSATRTTARASPARTLYRPDVRARRPTCAAPPPATSAAAGRCRPAPASPRRWPAAGRSSTPATPPASASG